MNGTKDRAFAAVLKAYAASAGVSLRTAQRHAKGGTDDWKRFSQATMVAGVSKPSTEPMTAVEVTVLASASPLAPPKMPESVDRPVEELAEPERILRAVWEMWAEHFAMWKRCLGGYEKGTGKEMPRDEPMACVHASMLIKLRVDYDKALQKHTQWEIDQRRLIPANEFHAFRSGFLIPLRNMMANMPAEMAPMVNPSDQQTAIKGGTEYLICRLYPQISQCIDALDRLTPRLAAA